jgi:hypothetical protein
MTAYKRTSDNRRTRRSIGQRPKSNRKDRLGLAEFVEGDGWVFSKIFLKSEILNKSKLLPHAKDAKDATEVDRRLRR